MRFACSLCLCISCLTVHGFAHAVGSSIVTTYSSVFPSRRVQRSIRCRFSRDPRKSVLAVKLVTSTTSGFPSHPPRRRRPVLPAGAVAQLVFASLCRLQEGELKRSHFVPPLLHRRRDGRNFPIRRIHNQRGAPARRPD